MNKPDVLIFFSDQHNADIAGFGGDPVIRTPCLDALVRDGVVFSEAYSACPLCVPARTSFLTGQLPSKTGVFDNDSTFSGDRATFIHCLAAEGYETVLCGRMHFIGENQRHGFTKRMAVSIMDIGPTICDLTGALSPPKQDGRNLLSQLTTGDEYPDRFVFSEYIDIDENGRLIPSRMIKQGKSKYITYHSYEEKDLLFNIEADPYELRNTVKENREIAEELKGRISKDWDREQIVRSYEEKLLHQNILEKWGKVACVEEMEQWSIPPTARELPRIV